MKVSALSPNDYKTKHSNGTGTLEECRIINGQRGKRIRKPGLSWKINIKLAMTERDLKENGINRRL